MNCTDVNRGNQGIYVRDKIVTIKQEQQLYS